MATYAHPPVAPCWAAAAMVALCTIGCGPPQASSLENQRLIGSLRTAISARNPQWLQENRNVLEQRRAAGKVADAEYEEFQAIIAMAEQGRWEAAERRVLKFLKSQRPTPEQIQQTPSRRPQ